MIRVIALEALLSNVWSVPSPGGQHLSPKPLAPLLSTPNSYQIASLPQGLTHPSSSLLTAQAAACQFRQEGGVSWETEGGSAAKW